MYSQELKWLPNGSEFAKESEKPDSKPSTYTSFSCSQDSQPEFAGNPISTMEDIIVAKLGPGQVWFFHVWLGGVNLSFTSSCNIFGKEVVCNFNAESPMGINSVRLC